MLKVAVIGSPDYHDFFKDNQPDWDWQIPSEQIADFYDNLDNGDIDDTTPMLILDPALYDSSHHDQTFEQFCADMAPYALVAIISFNDPDDTTPKDEIESQIAQNAQTDQGAHVYWIDADDILRSIDEVIEDYVNSGDSSPDVVQIFINELGLTPPEEAINDVVRENKRGDDFDFEAMIDIMK